MRRTMEVGANIDGTIIQISRTSVNTGTLGAQQIPFTTNIEIQQQQQHSLFSQASWGRLPTNIEI